MDVTNIFVGEKSKRKAAFGKFSSTNDVPITKSKLIDEIYTNCDIVISVSVYMT